MFHFLMFKLMNFLMFLYDVFVWITCHYYELPESFRKTYPEEKCVDARLFLSDLAQCDSDLNNNFKDYE